MIVTCEKCDARFNLKDSLVKQTGSKVRCSKCKHVFIVYSGQFSNLESPIKDIEEADFGTKSDRVMHIGEKEASNSSFAGQQLRLGDTLDGVSIPSKDLDLSEIEKMLATDAQGESVRWGDSLKPGAKESPRDSQGIASSHAPTMALDLSEIEKIFDMEEEMDDRDRPLESEPEDLIFDFEESVDREKEPQNDLGEFDIADIEKLLGEELVETETDETGGLLFKPNEASFLSSSTGGKDQDPSDLLAFSDLEGLLETDSDVKAAEAAASEEDELKFEIDDDYKPGSGSPVSEPAPHFDDLDFSDIEKSLDTDTRIDDAAIDEEEEELTLALDSDDKFDSTLVSVKDAVSPGMPDLSNLEDMLEEKVPKGSDEMSLELDLAEIHSTGTKSEDADDLVLHFGDSDTENRAESNGAAEMDSDQSIETEELDFEMESEGQDDLATADADSTAEDAVGISDEKEDAEEETLVGPANNLDTQPEKAKSNRKLWLILSALALFIGAFVGGHLLFGDQIIGFLSNNGIQIPFISGGKKAGISDAGNLRISTVDINNRFVDNTVAGRLFVITGKAKNGYQEARSLIRIIGKLYAKDKQLITSETVYCGNVIPDSELSGLSPEDIKARLVNQQGENGTNVNIRSGEDRPFMIVFSKLPDNLEEFTLEVAGSEPAAQTQKTK